jgi:hypothetical protein
MEDFEEPYDQDLYEETKERFPSSFKKKSKELRSKSSMKLSSLEDSDDLSDEEEEILIPSLSPNLPLNIESLSPTKISIAKAPKKKRGKIDPVVPEEEIPSLESFANFPYKNLIQKELSETDEMFECRSKIADLLSQVKLKFSSGKESKVSLDSLAILQYSRMINNYLWYDIKYESEAHNQMLEIAKMINLS